jgi:hypothetical protein
MKEKVPVENETIYFEDKKIPPGRDGQYKCPFKCGRAGYPARRWKTMAGFMKHLNECPRSAAGRKKQEEKDKLARIAAEERKAAALAAIGHRIGDTIHFVHEIIVKSEYEQRWGRQVRVRYEPVKRFVGKTIEVERIDWLEQAVFLNYYIRCPLKTYDSYAEAETAAKEQQERWDESVRFAEMCR